MSKFDTILKRIGEALPTMPQQPVTGTANPQQTQQQQQQAVQQAAKLLNIDPKTLQQILDAQKQQQQKPGTTQPIATTPVVGQPKV